MEITRVVFPAPEMRTSPRKTLASIENLAITPKDSTESKPSPKRKGSDGSLPSSISGQKLEDATMEGMELETSTENVVEVSSDEEDEIEEETDIDHFKPPLHSA